MRLGEKITEGIFAGGIKTLNTAWFIRANVNVIMLC